MAPLIRALDESAVFTPLVAVTAQHRSMLDQVNEVFGIKPEFDLDIHQPGQTLTDITTRALRGVQAVLHDEQPGRGGRPGRHDHRVRRRAGCLLRADPGGPPGGGAAHGRSLLALPGGDQPPAGDQARRAAPRARPPPARPTCSAENVRPGLVVVTGNTVIDALLWAVGRQPDYGDPALAGLDDTRRARCCWSPRTGASRGGLRCARSAARWPASRAQHRDLRIVFPVHRNPLVRDAILPAIRDLPNVTITEPLPYGGFARLMNRSTVILTDSGGVQEEGPSLGKPVLVMRETTERPEAVRAGTVRLVGTDEDLIVTVGRPPAHRARRLRRHGQRGQPLRGRAGRRPRGRRARAPLRTRPGRRRIHGSTPGADGAHDYPESRPWPEHTERSRRARSTGQPHQGQGESREHASPVERLRIAAGGARRGRRQRYRWPLSAVPASAAPRQAARRRQPGAAQPGHRRTPGSDGAAEALPAPARAAEGLPRQPSRLTDRRPPGVPTARRLSARPARPPARIARPPRPRRLPRRRRRGPGAVPAPPRPWSSTTPPNTWGWLGRAVRHGGGNLASHFGQVTAEPVVDYVSGQVNDYTATIYLGSTYNEPIPAAFLNDVLSTTHPVIWAGDNIWQLTGTEGSAADTAFKAVYGWDPSTSYFDTTDNPASVTYKGQTFTRNTANGADVLAPHITTPSLVTVLAQANCTDSRRPRRTALHRPDQRDQLPVGHQVAQPDLRRRDPVLLHERVRPLRGVLRPAVRRAGARRRDADPPGAGPAGGRQPRRRARPAATAITPTTCTASTCRSASASSPSTSTPTASTTTAAPVTETLGPGAGRRVGAEVHAVRRAAPSSSTATPTSTPTSPTPITG